MGFEDPRTEKLAREIEEEIKKPAPLITAEDIRKMNQDALDISGVKEIPFPKRGPGRPPKEKR